jgi:hypothetical protein
MSPVTQLNDGARERTQTGGSLAIASDPFFGIRRAAPPKPIRRWQTSNGKAGLPPVIFHHGTAFLFVENSKTPIMSLPSPIGVTDAILTK